MTKSALERKSEDDLNAFESEGRRGTQEGHYNDLFAACKVSDNKIDACQ